MLIIKKKVTSLQRQTNKNKFIMSAKSHSLQISYNPKNGIIAVSGFYYNHFLLKTTRSRTILACWYRLECDCQVPDNVKYQPLADVDLNITVNQAMEIAYRYLLEENGYKINRKGGTK